MFNWALGGAQSVQGYNPYPMMGIGGFSIPLPVGGNPFSPAAWQRFSFAEISRDAARSIGNVWREVRGLAMDCALTLTGAFADKMDLVSFAVATFTGGGPFPLGVASVSGAITGFLNRPVSPFPNTLSAKDPFSAELALLWDVDPSIKRIFDVDDPSQAKKNLQEYIASVEDDERLSGHDIHPMEWDIVQKAVAVLKDLRSKRNERQSGESAVKYLHLLARDSEAARESGIKAGFIAEMRHLFLGLLGKSGVYSGFREPAFLSMSGRDAAVVRSDDLDGIAAESSRKIARYRFGMDDDVVRERAENARRIKDVLGADDLDWSNWRWQLRNVIRDAEGLERLVALSDMELRAIQEASEIGIPFGITPYYASLMNRDGRTSDDSAIRAQVIPSPHYVEQVRMAKRGAGHDLDFMREGDTSPIDLVSRRYPRIAIFKPYNTCAQICVYCQRNWEIDGVLSPNALAPKAKIDAAIEWFARHPGITEVLITGGDPFLLSDEIIEGFLQRFSAMSHIERIRFGTRTPVVLPQRVTPELGALLAYYSAPGKREVAVVTHFEHVSEVTPEAVLAVQNLRRSGLSVYNQMVYTLENSRRFEAVATRRAVRLAGVDPYYTFVAKGKGETRDFRVPTARILQEQKEESRLMPGLARTDEVTFNVPRLGKNYLRAAQHHRLIAVRKDGTRVIEFHPWEKNLTRTMTYLSDDPPIYDYLVALAARGEDPSEYDSIWYYY